MKQLLMLALSAALFSCSGGADKNATENEKVSKEDQTPRVAAEYPRVDFNNDAEFSKEYKALQKKYRFIQYVTKSEVGNLYLFSKSQYSLPDKYNNPNAPFQKLGMTDGAGNELLECIYQKIGNPGGIVSGWVEIFQDGKYGLFNYATKKRIDPQFEVIFPSQVMGYIATGRKGEQYYKIYEDGRTALIESPSELPSYRALGKKQNFDIHDSSINWWTSILALTTDYEEYGEDFGEALIFPGSYLAALKVVPEFIDGIVALNTQAGIENLKVTVEKKTPRNKDVNSFLEAFYEEGSNGRGYETEEKHLVTVRNDNKVIDSKKIYSPYRLQGDMGKNDFKSVTFLNDSLIEVKETAYSYEEDRLYECMTTLSYFSIEASGKIKAIYPESYFEMASVVELMPEHLKGLFFVPNPDYNPDVETEEGEMPQNILITRQLGLRELQYMRNEVYARHGYIFKDASWNETFRKTKWYSGKSTNVDAKITPLEKKNLQFIQQWEKKLKADEQKYTKPEKATYFEAG